MLTRSRNCRAAWLAVTLAVFTAAVLPQTGLAQPASVEPQAEKLLRAATTYLAEQKQFSVETRSTIEVVLASGQKLQFDHTAALWVQRPNKLRAERRGDLVDQDFYYDGKSLTLHNPGDRYYATAAAPGTLEQMMDFARDSLDLIAPGGDLVYANAYDNLMEGVISGFVVGESVVEGTRCNHLAFRAEHVDWQIWIADGAQPLPCKMVITSTDVAGAPQFSVVMTKWNLEPKIHDQLFGFKPPQDAKKIDFVTPVRTGPPAR